MLFFVVHFSVIVYFFEKSGGVLVGDHAFVSAFDFIHEHDVDISSTALLEAGWESHPVEEVIVVWDVLELFLGTGCNLRGPDASVG